MTAASMLAAARKDLGMRGRPNAITREYAARHGSEFLKAAWCAMSITHWARESGNAAVVLPDGDRAYTVWFAQDGQQLGRWYAGTIENIRAHAKPGAIVFFDWNGTNSIGAIDHVGIVEKVLADGRVQTIEGNTGDMVARRIRSAPVIAGFWNPAYLQEDDMPLSSDDLKKIGSTVYKAVWATDSVAAPPDQADVKTNPTWQPQSYLKNTNELVRKVLAGQAAQNATIKQLVTALAAKDDAVDVDALMARIESAIEGITVRLDVAD